jgi:hypothetical protein
MSHARQQIREQIATLLKVTPTNWASVFETRIITARAVMPFLLVYVSNESSEQILIHPTGMYQRTASITIHGMLKMPGMGNGTSLTETVEDRLDAMASEIETKIKSTTVTKAKGISLQSTDFNVAVNESDGSVSHAELIQAWTVQYMTVEGSPDTLV